MRDVLHAYIAWNYCGWVQYVLKIGVGFLQHSLSCSIACSMVQLGRIIRLNVWLPLHGTSVADAGIHALPILQPSVHHELLQHAQVLVDICTATVCAHASR